jgi:hypothetical protein
MRATVDLETTGPSKASSSAASTSRTERPRRNEQTTNASRACVRATPLPTISLRIVLLANTGNQVLELTSETLARDYEIE